MCIIAVSCFLTCIYYAWNGTLRPKDIQFFNWLFGHLKIRKTGDKVILKLMTSQSWKKQLEYTYCSISPGERQANAFDMSVRSALDVFLLTIADFYFSNIDILIKRIVGHWSLFWIGTDILIKFIFYIQRSI